LKQILWTETGINFATAEVRRLEAQIRGLQEQHHSCRDGNSCTHDAFIDMSSINLEIAMLTQRLGDRRMQLAHLAEAPKPRGGETAQIGHLVTIRRFDDDGEPSKGRQTFLLGGWEEISDPEAKIQTISCNSPLGKALLGTAVREIAQMDTPGGIREVELISIELPDPERLAERRSAAA